MKSVLIICGSFPPQSKVGGLRPAMFAKYLPEFGWDPWVLTREFSQDDLDNDCNMDIDFPKRRKDQIIKIQYSLNQEKTYLRTRNLPQRLRDFFYPEYSCPAGLYFAAKDVAVKLIERTHFDLLFSTSPDQWELSLGSYLSKRYKIPLIADFRDIIEQEIGMKRSIRQRIQTYRFSFRRYLTTRQAIELTTVSQFHQKTLQYKLNRRTSIVYNGYDHLNFFPTPAPSNISCFRIIYMGRILKTWYQDPSILFFAVDELLSEKKLSSSDISIEFYGTDKRMLNTILNRLNQKDFIHFYDRIPYKQVPYEINEAQLLLLLTNHGRKGILTTKFFEYAGVKKPILCIPGDQNELDELLIKYKLGYSFSSIEPLKTKILEWIQHYKSGTFPSHVMSDCSFFTRQNQTKILSEIFNSVNDSRSVSSKGVQSLFFGNSI